MLFILCIYGPPYIYALGHNQKCVSYCALWSKPFEKHCIKCISFVMRWNPSQHSLSHSRSYTCFCFSLILQMLIEQLLYVNGGQVLVQGEKGQHYFREFLLIVTQCKVLNKSLKTN